MALREFAVFLLFSAPAIAQDVLAPMSVCEVARDLAAWEGKPVALAGRYSLREGAQWLSEEHCGGPTATMLRLVRDAGRAPHLPESAVMDQHAAERKLKQIQTATSLAKYRFGSPDYDRWAIVFGFVERSATGLHLVFRGDGVVFFYPEP